MGEGVANDYTHNLRVNRDLSRIIWRDNCGRIEEGNQAMKDYKLTTSANGYGIWQCDIQYAYPGLGNTLMAELVFERSLRSAKRSIRRAIQERSANKVRRLRYRVKANEIDSLNRIHGITIEEA